MKQEDEKRDGTAQALYGSLQHEDGTLNAARFYYGNDEPAPPNLERIDPSRYSTWIEDDGAIGIRRGTSVTIGATRQYTSKFDEIDWGN